MIGQVGGIPVKDKSTVTYSTPPQPQHYSVLK